MDRNQQPQNRELVFCHECENEWYRDEHGIICPECQSDFIEIIEADHDPRNEEVGGDHDFYAPDPDDGDIDDIRWTPHGPGQPPGAHFEGTIDRNMFIRGSGQDAGLGGGLTGLLGTALQGLLGGQQPRQQPAQQNNPRAQDEEGAQEAPGSHFQERQEQRPDGTFVRHAHGPNFSYTITSSSGNLFPRDANNAQPFQHQPDHINQLMQQMMMNILPPGPGFGGHMHTHSPDGPIFMGTDSPGMRAGAPTMGGPMPMENLFALLGMARGGVHGDAVYSQEALDRIITQLMEQHQSGNAPGPASAQAIDSLPKRKITEQDAGDNGKAECSICMDEAAVGSEVTELPCGHWFHQDCIEAWLGEHDTCPHCRQGIMPKDQANTDRPRQPSQAPLNDMHSPEYQRPRVPGEYPFPRANSSDGSGSTQNPFTVPDSPEASRPTTGSAGSMFSRMRDAFSPGGRNTRSRDEPNSSEGGTGNEPSI